MYLSYTLDGFSKRISDVDHTSNHGTSCEYAHPYFMKEHPCLLLSIKQKRGEKLVSKYGYKPMTYENRILNVLIFLLTT